MQFPRQIDSVAIALLALGLSVSVFAFDPSDANGVTLNTGDGAALYFPSFDWHRRGNPTDVDGDYQTTPADAMRIINELNANGARPLPPPSWRGAPICWDVNHDGAITALDASIVIKRLNNPSSSGGGTVLVASSEFDKYYGTWTMDSGPLNVAASSAILDLLLLSGHIGPAYLGSAGGTLKVGEFNALDIGGDLSSSDLLTPLSLSVGPGSSVPEPSTIVLALLGGATLFCAARKRTRRALTLSQD